MSFTPIHEIKNGYIEIRTTILFFGFKLTKTHNKKTKSADI